MDSHKPTAPNTFVRLGALARSVAAGDVSPAIDARGERRAAEAFANRHPSPKLKRLVGVATVLATAAAAAGSSGAI